MKIVVDTNIFLSALIKDSITRKIIVESNWNFYYPEISLHEIKKYRNLVLEKSTMLESEYEELLSRLLAHVRMVSNVDIDKYLVEAKNILGAIDPDDVVFLAVAMGIKDSVIWSDDKDFERQSRIKILKTKDIIELFFSNNYSEVE